MSAASESNPSKWEKWTQPHLPPDEVVERRLLVSSSLPPFSWPGAPGILILTNQRLVWQAGTDEKFKWEASRGAITKVKLEQEPIGPFWHFFVMIEANKHKHKIQFNDESTARDWLAALCAWATA